MTKPKAKKDPAAPAKPRRIRDRSVKDRPEPGDVGGLVEAVDAGRLDMRTRSGQKIAALRTAIAAAPVDVARGPARDVLAANAVIAQEIVRAITKPGFEVLDAQGEMNPVLAKYWDAAQGNVLKAAQTLLKLEQSNDRARGQTAAGEAHNGVSGPIDISALIIEASNDERSIDNGRSE